MASNSGWIKLHRELIDHPIWSCSTLEQRSILITLLCMVNYVPNQWVWKGEKYNVKAGQLITSLASIADKTGCKVSMQSVRTALAKFEKLDFLTNESTKQGRLITIINWDTYQDLTDSANKVANKELTKHQQRANKELTPIKERKKERKKELKSLPPNPMDWVPNETSLKIAYDEQNLNKHELFVEIQKMCNHFESKNEKRTDWNKVLQNWLRSGYRKPAENNQPKTDEEFIAEVEALEKRQNELYNTASTNPS